MQLTIKKDGSRPSTPAADGRRKKRSSQSKRRVNEVVGDCGEAGEHQHIARWGDGTASKKTKTKKSTTPTHLGPITAA